MKYIIIGGVAGGATAAARIRRISESAKIIMIDRGSYISYANCGLPYYIGEVIKDRTQLFVQTPESFNKSFNIDVRIESDVINIDHEKKTVTVKRSDGSEYIESYDKLLLSPGAHAFVPAIPGINSEGIFTLRNVNDTDKIKEYLTENKAKRAVVIGAGFIGLEMAENLHHTGAEVSIVEMADQVMPPVDFSTASILHQHLTDKNVKLYLKEKVVSFTKNEDGSISIHLASDNDIIADIVILSIGVRPETKLAQEAGITIGIAHGIQVDEFLETNLKYIYAVGDAIEYPHPITGVPYLNYLANPANRQAWIVANNMVNGNTIKYEGAIGTAIAKVFDLTVATTGMSAKRLKMMNIPYTSYITHSQSSAGYYPGATPVTIKLIFDPEKGQILGSQIVGEKGVDKRIDEMALVIKNKGTVYDLLKLEHAYAPPFSSAKDPVAIAGYTAVNILSKAMPIISWRDLHAIINNSDNSLNLSKKDIFIIDVRSSDETLMGGIDGAVNITLEDIRDHLKELPKDKTIIIFCAVGKRGYFAQRILIENGFKNILNLSGGYKTYSTATRPVKSPGSSTTSSKNKNPDMTMNSSIKTPGTSKIDVKILKVDACGLQCPGPIMKVKNSMDSLKDGEKLEIVTSDPSFTRDIDAWCDSTGNTLEETNSDSGKYTAIIRKGTDKKKVINDSVSGVPEYNNKTLIMFSDDLDKAIATFILANGAAATGQKTTIFFTFWGLNLLKKSKKPKVKKDIFGKMFSAMLVSNSLKLKLSKFNMFGIGSKMIRFIMKKNGVDTLEKMRAQALAQGVEFIACSMSMGLMGVDKEELIDGCIIGGVATYMGRAEKASVNLFI